MNILKPHITERSSASALNENHPVYTFVVPASANKATVAAAVKKAHQVTPRKVAIIKVKPKKIIIRGRVGYQPGRKKALVFLKPGDKISSFV